MLTYSAKARVQIGRRKLRYKDVRQRSVAIAIIVLSFVFLQWLSLHTWRSEPSPAETDQIHYRIGIAKLHGDTDDRLQKGLLTDLTSLAEQLPIRPVAIDRSIPANLGSRGSGHLQAQQFLQEDNIKGLGYLSHLLRHPGCVGIRDNCNSGDS